MQGEPQDPSCLGAYVSRICANLEKFTIRNIKKNDWAELNADHVVSKARNPYQEAVSSGEKERVLDVLSRLKQRDRDVLLDCFYYEFEREEVCAKYGLTQDQLRMILFHARHRFQKIWSAGESAPAIQKSGTLS